MSGIELAGLLLGVLPLVKSGLALLWEDKNDFGIVSAVALRLGLFDARGVVNEVREHFIRGDGGLDQAMAFKDSYTPTFNMVGVAGAILAQIALTALGLPNLDATHWTARASFVMGLVAGSLAVFCSCVLQSKMSALHNAHAVRRWLTRPRENWGDLRSYAFDQKVFSKVVPLSDRTEVFVPSFSWLGVENPTKDLGAIDLDAMKQKLSQLTEMSNEEAYRPSLSAALILTAPSQLLNIALGSLLTGFGIYFGFVYSARLPAIEDNHSALIVLAVYIASAASGLLLFYFPVLVKLVATMRDQKRNGLEEEIKKLEVAIQEVQRSHAASKQDGVLSALTRIISLQEEQLQLQVNSQALPASRFHLPRSHAPSSRPSSPSPRSRSF
jgi:uncharacterized membrane protein YedE/YeeE